MATKQSVQLPASDCPHCAASFEAAAPQISMCPECGYIPGHGSD
ncbi:hypothetical protein BDK61_1258 [Haloarcula quadrata]|jgi:ribosomal protein S27AE|uniref:Uncharacterized protein n=1 Tax=Haloarcula quadrata TaxID=182779 RepID=A0A495R3Q7_9EURY|nr:hypothetical protein BDK61_1258 [Haloarcula quadrata]